MAYWRQTLPSTQDCQVQATIPDKSQVATCMASGGQHLAVGTASIESKNLYLVKYDPTFKVVAAYQNAFKVRSVSVSRELVYVGCENNYVQVLKIGEQLVGVGNYAHVKDTRPSQAGQYLRCNSATAVSHNSQNPSQFATTEGCNLRVWDVNRNTSPLISAKVANAPISKGQWNGLSGLVATGSVDGSITAIDVRSMAGGFKFDMAPQNNRSIPWYRYEQDSGVTDVQWSPFVPYWLCTATQDGVVKVWDMRNSSKQGCVARIDTYQSATSVSWSLQHPSVLSIAGNGQWSLYNIDSSLIQSTVNQKKFVVGAEDLACFNQVQTVANVAVPADHETYISLSDTVELGLHVVDNDVLDRMAHHEYEDSLNPREYELEKLLNRFDFSGAINLVTSYAKSPNCEREELQNMVKMMNVKAREREVWSLHYNETDVDNLNNQLASWLKTKEDINIYGNTSEPVDLISSIHNASKYSGEQRDKSNEVPTLLSDISKTSAVQELPKPLVQFIHDLDSQKSQVPDYHSKVSRQLLHEFEAVKV